MKYYSILRPVMPGGFPKTAKVIEIVNFDDRKFCDEIGREAWGYIEYDGEIEEKDARAYDLIQGGLKEFWGVMAVANHSTGKVIAKVKEMKMAARKPEDTENDNGKRAIAVYWYETKEEAEAAAKEMEG